MDQVDVPVLVLEPAVKTRHARMAHRAVDGHLAPNLRQRERVQLRPQVTLQGHDQTGAPVLGAVHRAEPRDADAAGDVKVAQAEPAAGGEEGRRQRRRRRGSLASAAALTRRRGGGDGAAASQGGGDVRGAGLGVHRPDGPARVHAGRGGAVAAPTRRALGQHVRLRPGALEAVEHRVGHRARVQVLRRRRRGGRGGEGRQRGRPRRSRAAGGGGGEEAKRGSFQLGESPRSAPRARVERAGRSGGGEGKRGRTMFFSSPWTAPPATASATASAFRDIAPERRARACPESRG